MNITVLNQNQQEIANIDSDEVLISDLQSALDLIMTVWFETGCRHVILPKTAVCEEFFDLSTKLAGDILQKFVNYEIKLALIGDFSQYQSQSLKAFIYESNQGSHVFFLPDQQTAVDKLSRV